MRRFEKISYIRDAPDKGLGIFKYPQIILGVSALFLAIGAEVAIGSILINFFGLENIAGLDHSEASRFVAFYWGGLMIGRLCGAVSFSEMKVNHKLFILGVIFLIALSIIAYTNGIEIAGIYSTFMLLNFGAFRLGKSLPGLTTGVFSVCIIFLMTIAIFSQGLIAMWSVIGVGLFASIMWSNIFTLGIRKLGNYTSQGSSLLIMAILGAALIPPLQGLVADNFGIQISFIIIILCHSFVAWYGFKGHKLIVNV